MQPARLWAGPPVRASGLPLPALLFAVRFETVAHSSGEHVVRWLAADFGDTTIIPPP